MSKDNQLAKDRRTNQPNTTLPCLDILDENTTAEMLRKQFCNKGLITNVKGFITHCGQHIEEFASMVAILHSDEGKRRFSFVKEGYSINYPDSALPERYMGFNGFFDALEDGYILIGTGNGPYDEHGKRARTDKKSSASAVAYDLGITENKDSMFLFSRILKYVDYEDTHGHNFRELLKDPAMADMFGFGMLASSIKTGNFVANSMNDNSRLVDNANAAIVMLRNEIDGQRLMIQARDEYRTLKNEEKLFTELLPVPQVTINERQRDLVLHIVHTDSEAVVKQAKRVFSTAAERLGVLVSINSKGQFYICPMNGINLEEVVKILRVKIAQKRRQNTEWKLLKNEGALESSPELYVHKNDDGQIVGVMNGSLTSQHVPGLIGKVLSESDLLFAIRTGLNQNYFAAEHKNACLGGTCPAKASQAKCSFYHFGLQRCHDTRSNMSGGATIAEQTAGKTEQKRPVQKVN
jgi:hypothetical protein